MNTKNMILGLFILSLLGLGLGYILTNSTQYGLCISNVETVEASCINFYERLGDPLFYGMGALVLVFLTLLFVPRGFSAWKKFAIWFVPLATLLFIVYPEPGSGDFVSPYPEQVFQWASALYVVVSVVIIMLAHLRNPKNPNT